MIKTEDIKILIEGYGEAFEEGMTSNDWICILDIDLAKLGLNYLFIQLVNTGSYSLDYELKRTLPNGVESIETSSPSEGLTAGNHADFELTRPLEWKLYVKNHVTDQTTSFKLVVRVGKS